MYCLGWSVLLLSFAVRGLGWVCNPAGECRLAAPISTVVAAMYCNVRGSAPPSACRARTPCDGARSGQRAALSRPTQPGPACCGASRCGGYSAVSLGALRRRRPLHRGMFDSRFAIVASTYAVGALCASASVTQSLPGNTGARDWAPGCLGLVMPSLAHHAVVFHASEASVPGPPLQRTG